VSYTVYNTYDSLHYQVQYLHAVLNVQLAALVKQMNNVAAIATSFSNLAGGGQLLLTIQFSTLPPLLFSLWRYAALFASAASIAASIPTAGATHNG
jgi:hypothetical protein